MIVLPTGTQIWIAAGKTDLRRGFTGLSAIVQTVLKEKPFSGHVFVFRGRRGDLIKVLWWDGDGLCLFAKRLERGRFVWPQAESGTPAASDIPVVACQNRIWAWRRAGYSFHAFQKRMDFRLRQYNRQISRTLCANKRLHGSQRLLQNLPIQEHQSVESLVLSG